METNLKDFLFEDDYENFAQKLISLQNIEHTKDFLNFLIDSYYEKNKNLFMYLKRKVEDKKSEVDLYIVDKINNSLMKNPKLSYDDLLKSWNRANIGGKRSIKEFNQLIDLIHVFENEVKKDKIDKHYHYLNGFIHQAIKNNIETVFKSKNNDNSYDLINTDFDVSTESFQRFQRELKQLPTREIEVNIKNRFLPMLERYFDWYKLNREKTKKFEPNNFYEQMYENMVSTSREIKMYCKPIFEKNKISKVVEDIPSEILKIFVIYQEEYEKVNDHKKALTITTNKVEKDKERRVFNSDEVDEKKRHKNIKDSIRREFQKYGLISKNKAIQ
ncbi:hypothetical protein [Emticicia sp. SJ17W-69]|uniref:hypothetical protein n=1 Tax=Emticicia sp. SJ17W-69 TaxID=3421657 RepID=UPI003EBB0091